MKSHPIIIALLCVFLNQHSFGQSTVELEKGDKAFNSFDFEEALYFFSVAQESSPNDPEITRRLADTYRRMGQIAISADWYRKTLELDASNADDMLHYAEALKSLEQYDEVIYWYEMYDKLKPGDSRAKSHLQDKFYYKDLFADTARYAMKSLKINNTNPIIGVTLFEDEKILVSAVNLDKNKSTEASPFLDVYLCDFNRDKELVHPLKLDKKVNSKYHDGPAFYSFSEHKLYITRNNIRNGKPVRDKKGNVNLKIYSSEYNNGVWSSAQELKMNDDGYSTGHACVSKDGQTMYFVSTREGGYGGTDLYQCYKVGNSWSDPINLGPQVNTGGNEMFPFIGEDSYLYFASDGHAGLGGLDIFHAEYKNAVWQNTMNLGKPINSSMDDFALTYDKESDNGFFCSNRAGNGDDNLYFYKHILIDRMTVAGVLKSSNSNISLAGERIQIKKMSSGESTFQSLDAFERFEFTAEAGEKVEISFMNAEYFDSEMAVVNYEIPEIINDPFVNIGEKKVDLKKIPPHDGQLSTMTSPELAQTKSPLAQQIVSSQKENIENSKEANSTLNGLSSKTETQIVDESTLKAQQESEKKAKMYMEKMAQANALFTDKKYTEAKLSYISASAIRPEEVDPKIRITQIDKILQEEADANLKSAYNNQLKIADNLFLEKKYNEAKAGYNSALEMMTGEQYPKDQIAKIGKLQANALEEALMSKSDIAAKKVSEFEKAESIFDLVGMSMDNVIFDYNKSFIRAEDMPNLDRLAKLLKENPETKLLIRAHCDSRGSMAYNQSLSMSRAMAVQGYLMQKGIKRERVSAEWFGEQRPLNGCIDNVPCEEGQYEVNRRAEFKIVAKN